MKRITGGAVVLALLLLSGCGTQAAPAAKTVTSTVSSVATKTVPTTVIETTATTVVETETATAEPGIEFNELYADVRTAAAGAFDGWSNDTMKVVADMVCGLYHPDDQSKANVQAAALASGLIAIGVDAEHIVDVAKPILTANCPDGLGYFPNM